MKRHQYDGIATINVGTYQMMTEMVLGGPYRMARDENYKNQAKSPKNFGREHRFQIKNMLRMRY